MSLLERLISLEFNEFTKFDWDCFAGVESKMPLIAYDDLTTYIIDGEILCVIFEGEEIGRYKLTKG